ncbi:vacuolar protein sorting-associated protein 54-like isoform X2 [Tachypleus tridentatus]|uniref:vacuolar protein sorting-associated protein 54-like isoform X2 n=1 Tax=Tachypleus tridentatus TaxID=6853 RepID=UPI003FD34D88
MCVYIYKSVVRVIYYVVLKLLQFTVCFSRIIQGSRFTDSLLYLPSHASFHQFKGLLSSSSKLSLHKERGSFICQYGKSGVCAFLPAEGVCSQDYIEHVIKHHLIQKGCPSDGLPNMKSDYEHHDLQKGERLSNIVNDYNKWTVHNSSQNLPAVLNDLRRSKRELDFFIKTWGDSFVEQGPIPSSPYIPEVTRKHFDTYLRRINKIKDSQT